MKNLMPRLADFLFILLFLSVLSLGPRMLNIDGDLPRHLLVGKVVLETGAAPTKEIFSYVYENKPYTPHEWLADVIYYAIYAALGLNGVVLLAGFLIGSAFVLLYSEARSQNDKPFLTFLLIILGAFVTSIHWVTRPHLFTMLLLSIWIILIERVQRGTAVKLWMFPALMLFWANIHAEFIAGFLVLIAYVAGCVWQYLFQKSALAAKTGRQLLLIALLSFGASMINPVGLRTWDVVVGYVNNRYLLARIAETRPPNFTQAEYLPLLILLVIAILLLLAKRNRFAPAQFFLMAGFGIMSLLSARNAHLSGIVFPFTLSLGVAGSIGMESLENIEMMFRRTESKVTAGVWSFGVAALLSILLIVGALGIDNQFEPAVFPVEAVKWLEGHPQTGRMFNAFDWGGYLLFHLWPEQKVFIESQTDVTGDVTRQYETVVTLQEGWQDIFAQYDIRWAILPPPWPLTEELKAQGWETLYQDQTAIILSR